jgi:hypothetical protein
MAAIVVQPREIIMLKRLILALLLLAATFSAKAADYSDAWWNPTESGWGAFLVQSNTFQFIAFYIYGQDGKPTWYTAELNDDGTGTYTGPLYATTGTPFSLPWDTAQFHYDTAGTTTFKPIDPYHATLTYTVNGFPTVTKTIQRETLRAHNLAGNYSGSMSGTISGCSDPTLNEPAFRGRYSLQVTQVADTSATLNLAFVDPTNAGTVCALSGPLTHLGRLYQMANATITCTGPGQDGLPRSATVDSLHPTGQGIEGRLTSNFGGGCAASLRFAAVLNN